MHQNKTKQNKLQNKYFKNSVKNIQVIMEIMVSKEYINECMFIKKYYFKVIVS